MLARYRISRYSTEEIEKDNALFAPDNSRIPHTAVLPGLAAGVVACDTPSAAPQSYCAPLPMRRILFVGLIAAGIIAITGCDDAVGPSSELTLTISAQPQSFSLLKGDTVVLEARLRDSRGEIPEDVQVAWMTDGLKILGVGKTMSLVLPDTGLFGVTARAFVGSIARPDVARVFAIEQALAEGVYKVKVLPNSSPAIILLAAPDRMYSTDTARFIAAAADSESDAQVEWFSNRLGKIGVGDTLLWSPGDTAAGPHMITARARDPQGNHQDTSVVTWAQSTSRFKWSNTYQLGLVGDAGAMLALADDGKIYAGFAGAYDQPDCSKAVTLDPLIGRCLYAIAPDGTLLWTYQFRHSFWDHSSALTIAPDGRVFAADYFGFVYALSPSGTLLWDDSLMGRHNHGRFALSPDGALYGGGRGGDHSLIRIDPNNGALIWSMPGPGGYSSGPTILPDGRLAMEWGSIQQIVSESGVVVRDDAIQYGFAGGHYMTAMDANAVSYYPSAGGTLSAVTPDGVLLWQLELGWRLGEPVIGADGTLYAVGGSTAYGIAPDGTINWTTQLEGRSWIPRLAVLADGTIWAALDRNLWRLTAATGEVVDVIKFTTKIQSPLAVANDGTVYLITDDNRMFAVKHDAPLDPQSPWPIWRHDNRRTASVAR